MRLRWPEGEDLVRYLLGFGNGLEVVSPPELRDSVEGGLGVDRSAEQLKKSASGEH